jgi:hypothetical chaperone protein
MKNGLEAIGIDFGTTNTVASARLSGKVRTLSLEPSSNSPFLMKTLLYFPDRKDVFFGKAAIDEYFDRGMEGRFLQSIKRLLPNPHFTGTSLFGRHSKIEDLVSIFLKEVRTRIEREVGSISGTPIIMGKPARYHHEEEKESLGAERFKRAIELAGFDLAQTTFLEEPVAASRSVQDTRVNEAKALEKKHKEKGPLTLIADLGGGTSDYTLFERLENGSILTHAVNGVPLAGDALDSDFFVAKLNSHFGADIRYQRPLASNVLTLPTLILKQLPKWHYHAFLKEPSTWNFITSLRKELVDEDQQIKLENLIALIDENLGYKLHISVESLKIALSQSTETQFDFKSYPIEIEFPVHLPDYEKIISYTSQKIVDTALETCVLGKKNPDEVRILQFTGGTSKVPLIRERLKKSFPNAVIAEHETFTAVADGLASKSIHS